MAVQKPLIFDQSGSAARLLQQGDVMGGAEYYNTLATVGAGTITGALFNSNLLKRTGPTGAFTDTTDTAANIIAAILATFVGTGVTLGGVGGAGGIQPGTTWRLRYINTVAFAMTLAAGAGVTIVANGNVNPSSVKDYLITITNGTPTQVFTCNTNTSTSVTGMSQSQTNQLSVGMAVTGSGVAANSVITAVIPGVGVTLNNATTTTVVNNSLTFTPTISIEGIGQGLL
jgi:hypothetical protein